MHKDGKHEKKDLPNQTKDYETKEKSCEDDLGPLNDILDQLGSRTNIGIKILQFLKRFTFIFGVFYIVCLVAFGFLFNSLKITNKFSILYISLGLSFFLTLIEISPMFVKRPKASLCFILLGFSIILLCLLNGDIGVFKHSTAWIFYIVQAEGLYMLITYLFVRMKFNYLRRNDK